MKDISKLELVRTMLGKELTAFTAKRARPRRAPAARPFVEASNLSAGVRVRDVSLTIGQGEIAGLAGLLGSGRTETARLIFAADRRDGGTVTVDGEERSYAEPADAIADGIGFVSEDRKVEGIIPEMSVRENMTLALLPRLTEIRHRRPRRAAGDRRALHQGARRQMRLARAADPRTVRRQPAEGAAGALALHGPAPADRRRADARHRCRRQGGDPAGCCAASPTRA